MTHTIYGAKCTFVHGKRYQGKPCGIGQVPCQEGSLFRACSTLRIKTSELDRALVSPPLVEGLQGRVGCPPTIRALILMKHCALTKRYPLFIISWILPTKNEILIIISGKRMESSATYKHQLGVKAFSFGGLVVDFNFSPVWGALCISSITACLA